MYNNISPLGLKSTENSQYCSRLMTQQMAYCNTVLSDPILMDICSYIIPACVSIVGYSSAAPAVDYSDTALSCATPAVGYCVTALPSITLFCTSIIEGCWQNVLTPKQACLSALHAYRSNVFILNSINNLTWMLRILFIQCSYIITWVLHFMFVILDFVKMTGINYGIWASISTHWL